jgi:hypothetical protein
LPPGISTSAYRLAVSVLDRYGNEFAPRILGFPLAEAASTSLTFPPDYATVRIPVVFRWEAVAKADSYVWQLATDPAFSDIVCTRETAATQFDTSSQMNIREDGRTYYWRVRTRKADAVDSWSEPRRVILSSGGGSGTVQPEDNALSASIDRHGLTIESAVAGEAVIHIYNLSGQLVAARKVSLQSGRNTVPLEGLGISLIHIRCGDEETTVKGYNF